MAIRLLWARIGAVTVLALLAVVLGCGKKAAPAPSPRDVAIEGEKSEAPRPPEKKPEPGLSDLTPVVGPGWDVQPDPGPAIGGKLNLRDSIPFEGPVVVPATVSPFVAVGVPKAKAKGTYRAHDLRTMDAVGERVVVPRGARLALSPDGKYLSAWVKDKAADVIEVWSVQTGKPAVRREYADAGRPIGVALLPGERLWVELMPSAEATEAQVWGLNDGKKVGAAPGTPTVVSSTFSPGGRYRVEADVRGSLRFVDLPTGTATWGRLQTAGAAKGLAVALEWSSAGDEVAVLWRLHERKDDIWGRLACWDVKTGRKLHDHPLRGDDLHSEVDALWKTGKRVVQFWPGRRGWMLFGYLLIDRESGAIVHKLGLPLNEADMQDRRFLDAGHVTEARDRVPRAVKVVALPKLEIERGMKVKRD